MARRSASRLRLVAPLAGAALLALGGAAAGAPDEPASGAPGDDELVVIRAGAVLTVTGEELRPGTIVVRGGKVEAVGARVDAPPRARVLDLGDRVVLPGLVVARTRLGLPGYERSGNQAHLSAGPELAAAPRAAEAALERGVVLLGVIPAGGGVPGQAVAVRPGAGLVAGGGYLRVRLTDLPDDKRTLRGAFEAAKAALDKEAAARAEFDKRRAAPPAAGAAPVDTTQPFQPPPIAEPLRPFVALLRKQDAPRALVEVSSAGGWVHLEEGFERHGLCGRVLLGIGNQSDLHLVAERIARRKPLALLLPRLSFELNTRTRRNLPAELARAGARVALLPPADDDDGLEDWLGAVALLVRDGLPRAEALKAITLHAAEVLGLEGEAGAIEKGRRADLVVLDGDPFEVGARPVATLVAGRVVWERPGEAAGADAGDEEAPWRAR